MPGLARQLGFVSLLIYGIGDILGAGIYAIVGRVVDAAGGLAWLVFAASAVLAVVTGLSYAELSSRIPHAAGAAAFVKKAFRGKLAATIAGTLVLGTGLVSAATVTLSFTEYFLTLVQAPPLLVQLALVSALSFLSFWGIRESARVNATFTAIEVSGLLAVIGVGFTVINPEFASGFLSRTFETASFTGFIEGITLAYFAFVGFEDLCNLADEAKEPAKDIPRAILGAILIATALYMFVTIILQLTVPLDSLSASQTPLLLVFEKAGLGIARYFSVVAMLAITNTALANLIMASRLLYGMSNEGLIHKHVGLTHSRRQTPWVGVLISLIFVVLLVLTGGVKVLAQTTSLLVLCVFFLVHVSLIRVKRREKKRAGWHTPIFIPFVGIALTLGLALFYPLEAYLRALILPGAGLIIWAFHKYTSK